MYSIKRTNVAQQRFYCKDCGCDFTERAEDFNERKPLWLKKQIVRLYDKEKDHINKYDHLKKKTYSTREISKQLGISKSFVHKIIKNE